MHRRRKRARWGGAVIEMALISPLLIMMIFGQLEVMRVGMVAQLLTNGAREGCRVAVLNGTTATQVKQRVTATLAGSGINLNSSGSITITPANPSTTRLGDPIRVDVGIPYNAVSWIPIPSYIGNPTIRSSATMSSERPGG